MMEVRVSGAPGVILPGKLVQSMAARQEEAEMVTFARFTVHLQDTSPAFCSRGSRRVAEVRTASPLPGWRFLGDFAASKAAGATVQLESGPLANTFVPSVSF